MTSSLSFASHHKTTKNQKRALQGVRQSNQWQETRQHVYSFYNTLFFVCIKKIRITIELWYNYYLEGNRQQAERAPLKLYTNILQSKWFALFLYVCYALFKNMMESSDFPDTSFLGMHLYDYSTTVTDIALVKMTPPHNVSMVIVHVIQI